MITKDFFYVGKDSTNSNYSTFPNQLIDCFDHFTHTELKRILLFQSCPPAQRFNISAISKKVGGNWKRTNDAINKLIEEKTIVIKTTKEGFKRYCIDFTEIIEQGQQNKSAINLVEPTFNAIENLIETSKISSSTLQVEFGFQTTTNNSTTNVVSTEKTVSAADVIEPVEKEQLGRFFESESGITEEQLKLQKSNSPAYVSGDYVERDITLFEIYPYAMKEEDIRQKLYAYEVLMAHHPIEERINHITELKRKLEFVQSR
jgi:hypothetical protein